MRFRAWDGWGGGSDPELRFLNVCVCVCVCGALRFDGQ